MNGFHVNVRTDDRMSLADFRDCVRRKVTPGDPASMMNVAHELVALSNNTDIAAERFVQELANWHRGVFSMYSPQSCILDAFDEFTVRLNFWPLLPADPRRRHALAQLLSYFDFHDHNFSFLTTNYFGPGYETEIYEYDYASVEGIPGEDVSMRHLGRYKLGSGDVFLFRSGVHIHSQLPPEATSASINLMMSQNSDVIRQEQFYFDVESRRITGYVESASSKRNSLMNFVPLLGDARSRSLLTELATEHMCPRLRREAKQVLAYAGTLPAG